jgi:hypothetical protein
MAMTDNLFNSSSYSAATPADYLNDINEVLESIGEFPVTTAPTSSSGTMIHERALRFLERANTRIQAQGWPVNTGMAETVNASVHTITAITKASPATVTVSPAHGLITGDRVFIQSVVGMVEVNNLAFTITSTGTTTFTLDGTDSSAYTTYSSAGSASGAPRDSIGPTLFLQAAGKDGHRTLTMRRSSNVALIYDADAGALATDTDLMLDVVRKISWEQLPDLLKANIVTTAALDMQRRLQGSPQADAFYQQEKVLRDQGSERLNPMKKNAPLMNVQPLQMGQQQQQQG